MAQIKGIDISSWQGQPNFNLVKNDAIFGIFKSSEGTVFRDPQLARNVLEARRVGMIVGYYHFARPDAGNSPEAEAQYFINQIWPIQPGELLVLDYEVNYYDPVGWCKRFLDYLSNKLNGTKALIYLNGYLTNAYNWKPVVDGNYGLWLAYYDNDPNNINYSIGKWPFAAMKQYWSQGKISGISGNVDINTFFGDATTLKKYGYKEPNTPTDPYIALNKTLKTAIDRLKTEFDAGLANPTANQKLLNTETMGKVKKISDTGTL